MERRAITDLCKDDLYVICLAANLVLSLDKLLVLSSNRNTVTSIGSARVSKSIVVVLLCRIIINK